MIFTVYNKLTGVTTEVVAESDGEAFEVFLAAIRDPATAARLSRDDFTVTPSTPS